MMPRDTRLRQCRSTDQDALVDIYREGFKGELSFFFKRFCGCFFEALFHHLSRDTIVAEVGGEVVGFVIVVRGPMPVARSSILRLLSTMPTLLTAVRPSFFAFLLQRTKSMSWRPSQVGIGCIAVESHFRRKGFGRALMRGALARYHGRNVTLDVRPWNTGAIRLYSSTGFRRTGVWRDPLGEWVVMSRTPVL